MDLIYATTATGLFGSGGKLPWSCKEDMQHFSRTTTDTFKLNIVIMGRKTWESLPCKLAGRYNIVITSNETKPGYDCKYDSLEECISSLIGKLDLAGKIFVIGGKSLISAMLTKYSGVLDNIYYTMIKAEEQQTSDSIFINYDLSSHDLIAKTETPAAIFYHYRVYGAERQYLNLLKKTLTSECRQTRNAETLSIFGENITFDLTKGFPLLTTKKMFMRGIFEELMLFIRGQTDSKILETKGVNIWKGNTSEDFIKQTGLMYQPGDMGPMYGFNWVHFGADYIDCKTDYTNKGYNQLADVLNLLEHEPHSRRILLTDYNPAVAKLGVLYPCHSIIVQFYVTQCGEIRYVSMNTYQRSVDEFLGLPFNIASSALFLHLICATLNARNPSITHMPHKLNILMGDCHIYKSHIGAVTEQLTRYPFNAPNLVIGRGCPNIADYEWGDVKIINYESHPAIKADMVA